jgi:E3 ubiquitin-protein ligase HUWE1
LYKQLLGYQPSFEDLERMDPQLHAGLQKILAEPGADFLCMNFVVPTALSSAFGDCAETEELIEGGANIDVTDENKSRFVDLIVEHKLIHSIAAQVDQMRAGLYDIVPLEYLLSFDEYELELLISGLPWIDVDDWARNTQYFGYRVDSDQVVWFWKVVRSLSQQDLCRLLQFTTGSSRVPPDGFQSLRGAGNNIQLFSIQFESSTRLPSAHTCFNQLILPAYPSEKLLEEMLLTAINEGSAGFSIV